MEPNLAVPLPHPPYADHVLYHAYDWGAARRPSVRAWEFNGWRQEGRSWHDGCYIHAGLSRTGPVSISGPGATEWLQSLVINSFATFPVGSMKHAVMCDDDGLIVAHGIVERKSEDEYESFAGGPPGLAAPEPPPGVQVRRLDHYLFQIAGPTSLQVLERVTGESLRDVGFLRFRPTTVQGIPSEIGRIGMTGNLAYELHGPIDDAPAVYDAVYQAGHDLGLERLGWGTYLCNHIEGGFPQHTWTFATATDPDRHPEAIGFWRHRSGSVDPADRRARTRTPVEVRWHNMARFDHDFPGRAALEAEIAHPRRTTVTLRWHPDDVLDTYAALLRPDGPAYRPIDFPYAPQRWPMAHADHVLIDGRPVGVSSGTAYSARFREVISHGCLDLDATELGTEVIVQWGDHGGPLKSIRATVARFPYLDQGRNRDVDVATLPQGV